MEGHLRRGANAQEDIPPYKHGDRFCRGADGAPDDAQNTSGDKEIPPAENIAEPAHRGNEYGQCGVVY